MSGADPQARTRLSRPSLRSLALALGACASLWSAAVGAAPAVAAASSLAPAREVEGVRALLDVLPVVYKSADATHEAAGAERARTMAGALSQQLASWQTRGLADGPAAPAAVARELSDALQATRERLQPWPVPLTVEAFTTRLRAELARSGLDAGATRAVSSKPYAAIDALLADARGAAAGLGAGAPKFVFGRYAQATALAAEAYALYASGPGKRLNAHDSAVAGSVEDAFWQDDRRQPGLIAALHDGAALRDVQRASDRAQSSVETGATVLGDRTIGKDTVVADAAVIVFREGLEAVLILAAITASFVGERRRLRRPVLLGALAGFGLTALTYVLAQVLIDALGDGGLRLQAITGLLAIAVLLLVTNWFFHRVYWSEWIGRFHRRRRALERFEGLGFVSGQLLGLVLLGLTSVYREGFETVLFLQNMQVSAGSQATALGILIGLAGTLAVGFFTFKLERKLPYKKMLIATGVLIGLVLGVMVGTTVHSLQGLGWVPSTPTGFALAPWWGQWLGVFATWEGIGAQLAALVVVYGSYALARQLQSRRYRRAPRELATPARS
jgi:high-affinity iron transporter